MYLPILAAGDRAAGGWLRDQGRQAGGWWVGIIKQSNLL
jgi:hypothetical protein